jgi:hypothetical protein
MVEEPSHGEQLSLKHVCNIGLIPIAHYAAKKADVWMTALLLQCFCQYFFMKLGEAFCWAPPQYPILPTPRNINSCMYCTVLY